MYYVNACYDVVDDCRNNYLQYRRYGAFLDPSSYPSTLENLMRPRHFRPWLDIVIHPRIKTQVLLIKTHKVNCLSSFHVPFFVSSTRVPCIQHKI